MSRHASSITSQCHHVLTANNQQITNTPLVTLTTTTTTINNICVLKYTIVHKQKNKNIIYHYQKNRKWCPFRSLYKWSPLKNAHVKSMHPLFLYFPCLFQIAFIYIPVSILKHKNFSEATRVVVETLNNRKVKKVQRQNLDSSEVA